MPKYKRNATTNLLNGKKRKGCEYLINLYGWTFCLDGIDEEGEPDPIPRPVQNISWCDIWNELK